LAKGIFEDLENVAKNHFSEKKIFGNFLTQEFYTFLKSAQNSDLFQIFFKSYKGGCDFFKVRSSNNIETVQYFKKRFFIN
jgi:hypothetical protein